MHHALPLTIILSCAFLCAAQAGRRPTTSSDSATTQKEWQKFSPQGGNFSVLLPDLPKDVSQTFNSSIEQVQSHMYARETSEVEYLVGYVDFTSLPNDSKKSKSLLDMMRDNTLKKQGGWLTTDKDISIANYPGREMEIDTIEGSYYDRIFLVSQRLYLLTAYVPNSAILAANGSQEGNVFKFLNSFKLMRSGRGTAEEVGSLNPTGAVLGIAAGDVPKKVVTGGVLNGKALSLPKPKYPSEARAAGASGLVTIQVTIDEEGQVIAAHSVKGHPLLMTECIKAARAAQFSPTLLEGQPVKVTGVITYNFLPR